jgi:acetate---CoA ligase (ADP-forming)
VARRDRSTDRCRQPHHSELDAYADRLTELYDAGAPEEHRSSAAPAVRRMLGAQSIAVVGASARTGSFGKRLTIEVLRSPAQPRVHLVNPRYSEVLGRPCLPSLADIEEPVDLVLLGTPDSALVDQLELAAARGDGGAVVFGTAAGLAPSLVEIASDAGLAVCGASCMGFVNVDKGVRALGYIERYPQTPGPISLVTHSGSVFSALLRTHRRLEFALAVSSGQELVTTTGDYLAYALDLERTRVVALYLETIRDAELLKSGLARAASRGIPVVALTVGGGSPTGRAMVSAHSGAIAGDDAAWEALFDAYGVHRVRGLDEMADTLELFAIGRRVKAGPAGVSAGIATVHDSGAERAMVSDVASEVEVPFAAISAATRSALEPFLDPGLTADNPLDVWGRGTDTEQLFTGSLLALARDPAVSVVAIAVDLIREYDGDDAYLLAVKAVLDGTSKPVVVLSNMAGAIDQDQASELRALGVPVLEGTESGLRALRHLLHHFARRRPLNVTGLRGEVAGTPYGDRRARWIERISQGPLDGQTSLALLADYGVSVAAAHPAVTSDGAVDVAERIGYPVVLKTDEPAVAHKSDVGGVVLDLYNSSSVATAWAELAARQGPRVVVQSQVPASVELAVGVLRDPLLGPLVVLAAGGTLIELLRQRRVALPPLDRERAGGLVAGLPAAQLLEGVRGRPAADRAAVIEAVVSVGQLAVELGDVIEAVDINPLIAGPSGAIAVDALVIPRSPS